jgi:hypothetical protein
MKETLDKVVLEQLIWMENSNVRYKFNDTAIIVETTGLSTEQKDKLMEFEERKRPFLENAKQ